MKDVPNIVALGKKCAAPAGGAAARRKAKEDGWHGVVVERLATLDGAVLVSSRLSSNIRCAGCGLSRAASAESEPGALGTCSRMCSRRA